MSILGNDDVAQRRGREGRDSNQQQHRVSVVLVGVGV
jgi:hypothetical protein